MYAGLMASDSTPHPWLSRSDESETDFLWFRAWLTNAWEQVFKPVSIRTTVIARARSIEKCANWLGVPASHLEHTSRRFAWVDRAIAFDNHTMSRYLGNRLATIEEFRAAQDMLTSEANEVTALALEQYKISLGDGPVAEAARNKLKVMRLDVTKLMDVALHYQSQNHKPATEATPGSAENAGEVWNFENFTREDHAEYRRLRKLAGLDS